MEHSPHHSNGPELGIQFIIGFIVFIIALYNSNFIINSIIDFWNSPFPFYISNFIINSIIDFWNSPFPFYIVVGMMIGIGMKLVK